MNELDNLINVIRHEFERRDNDTKKIVDAIKGICAHIERQEKLIKDLQEGAADYFLTGTDFKDNK